MAEPPARFRVPIERTERVALAILLGAVLLTGVRAVTGPEERIAFLFYDDAYYYFTVARNLAAGLGSTFDGFNPTNGYHPLWCALLVPVLFAIEDPGAAVRIIGAIWFGLAAAATCAVWWAVRGRTGPEGALVAAALFGLQPAVGIGLARPNGLETPLYALAIAVAAGIFARALDREPPDRHRPFLLLGVALGLVTLARLDGGTMSLAAGGLALVHLLPKLGPGRAVGRLAQVAAVAALLVGPFLVWSTARFGHPVPVSGRVVALGAEREREAAGGAASAAFARQRAVYAVSALPRLVGGTAVEGTPLERRIRGGAPIAGLLLLSGAGILAAAGLAARRRRGASGSDAVVLLVVFAALHYAVYAGWLWSAGEERYRAYYFMPQVLALAAAAGAACGPALERWRSRSPRSMGAGAVLGSVVLIAYLAASTEGRIRGAEAVPGPVSQRHIYGWIKKTLPEDAILGARDAGKLGFFSGRPVVNLDGLINDDRFLRALRDGTEDEYIARSPVGYILVDRPWLGGFDPARPEIAPPRSGFGETLHRLAARPGITLREIPGATDEWVVIEVVRENPA